ncbi:hypothetical protein A3G14_04750 [Candidatus Curtissbacteria bacterium RIFCSPLOWO2_12_FULL_38_9]|uniref:Uncharacterized protein n=1 Tax=Candidatus Curtissbacteria bacterium RIFCSPLOWO2_12_FULL_38_9 TaxID=1797735 RepID=A0A1F5IC50_9BACT|nr:MAG: hypothetical protein A3G14_04750 [Candidatus Curtissbacteria bacterium RIFCSPLOWO2_12_FULL_38_9]
MDKRMELEARDLRVIRIEEMMDATEKALDFCETEIKKKHIDGFEQESAAELGSRYTAYWLEYWLRSEDLARARHEAAPTRKINFSVVQSLRGEAGIALFAARQDGDYSGVKKYLGDLAKDIGKNDPNPRLLVSGLETLIEKLPAEKGSKFIPPTPAWMDDRFKVEHESVA